MRKSLLIFPLIFLFSCSSSENLRTPSSVNSQSKSLEEQYFGHAVYKQEVNTRNKRIRTVKEKAVIYLSRDLSDTKGVSYYAVVGEYLPASWEFFTKFLKPNEKRGYLKELFKWINVYKVESAMHSSKRLNFYPLKVEAGRIVKASDNSVGILELPSQRASLHKSKLRLRVGEKNLLINFTRKWPHVIRPLSSLLCSTWDKDYIKGPYNPGYNQGDVEVLHLLDNYNYDTDSATAIFNVTELKDKPLLIKGRFNMTQDKVGLYTFTKQEGKFTGAELIEDKIGVFIDVYNAKKMGMTTDELFLVDPADAYGSQTYFEAYDNEDD